jgi:hypothetical protein
VGNKWVSYNRLDVPGNNVGMIADYMQMRRDLDIDTWDKHFAAVAFSVVNMLKSKTYLRGFSDVIDAIKDPDVKGMKYIQTWSKSLMPAGVGAVAEIVDPVRRETESVLQVLQSRTPYFSKNLPPRRDFYGEPTYISEHPVLGLALPLRMKEEKADPVISEILRNNVSIPYPPKQIGGIRPSEDPLKPERAAWGEKLTPEQYSRYVELARKEMEIGGKTFKERMEALVESPSYQRQSEGPDGGKALLLRSIVNLYDDAAKDALQKEFPELKEKVNQRMRGRAEALRPQRISP